MTERDPKRKSDRQPATTLEQPLDRGPSRVWRTDPELFGKLSEGVARYIGSWRFIAWMTVLILAWLAYNILAPDDLKPDPYPFTFLVLLLSLQASYAAPLILLAQNREADRDRVQYTEDSDRAERLVEDTEYLMRELATLRSALGEVATRDFVRGEFRDLLADLPEEISRQQSEPTDDPDAKSPGRSKPHPRRNSRQRGSGH